MQMKTPLLAGAIGALAVAGVAAAFNDVPQNHWAFDEVHWLRADGMLEGWGGNFHGTRQFTRYEMATVLSRYMQRYEQEKARVEAELAGLRRKDAEHDRQIGDLEARTSALEARLGVGAESAMAPPIEVAPPGPTESKDDRRADAALRERVAEMREKLRERSGEEGDQPGGSDSGVGAAGADSAGTPATPTPRSRGEDPQTRYDSIRARYVALTEALGGAPPPSLDLGKVKAAWADARPITAVKPAAARPATPTPSAAPPPAALATVAAARAATLPASERVVPASPAESAADRFARETAEADARRLRPEDPAAPPLAPVAPASVAMPALPQRVELPPARPAPPAAPPAAAPVPAVSPAASGDSLPAFVEDDLREGLDDLAGDQPLPSQDDDFGFDSELPDVGMPGL